MTPGPRTVPQDCDIKRQLLALQRDSQIAQEAASALGKGMRVRIIKEFHDQPWGKSKPNLIGKEYEVTGITMFGRQISVSLKDLWCSPWLDQVEFL